MVCFNGTDYEYDFDYDDDYDCRNNNDNNHQLSSNGKYPKHFRFFQFLHSNLTLLPIIIIVLSLGSNFNY